MIRLLQFVNFGRQGLCPSENQGTFSGPMECWPNCTTLPLSSIPMPDYYYGLGTANNVRVQTLKVLGPLSCCGVQCKITKTQFCVDQHYEGGPHLVSLTAVCLPHPYRAGTHYLWVVVGFQQNYLSPVRTNHNPYALLTSTLYI